MRPAHQYVVVGGEEGPGMVWGFLAAAKGKLACLLVHQLWFSSFPSSFPSMPVGSGLQVSVAGYMGEKRKPTELCSLSSSPEVPGQFATFFEAFGVLLLLLIGYFPRYLGL